MVIYSRAILVAVTSGRLIKVICKTFTRAGTFANTNIADPDQTPLNAESDQGLHYLFKLQAVKG